MIPRNLCYLVSTYTEYGIIPLKKNSDFLRKTVIQYKNNNYFKTFALYALYLHFFFSTMPNLNYISCQWWLELIFFIKNHHIYPTLTYSGNARNPWILLKISLYLPFKTTFPIWTRPNPDTYPPTTEKRLSPGFWDPLLLRAATVRVKEVQTFRLTNHREIVWRNILRTMEKLRRGYWDAGDWLYYRNPWWRSVEVCISKAGNTSHHKCAGRLPMRKLCILKLFEKW